MNETESQRQYYVATAEQYDAMHLDERDEHYFALCVMLGLLDFLQIRSILDVGSGTGRALRKIKEVRPDILVRGVEPVKELREVGYSHGISREELTEGDAMALPFEDGEFDLVTSFGVLHHVRTPDRVIEEMLRTARKAVFISDSNNFGQGGLAIRALKQVLDFLNLWPLANAVKTRGRGYTFTPGDGLAYSYSLFTNYARIKRQCSRVHLINTREAGANLYRSAGHVAMMCVKD